MKNITLIILLLAINLTVSAKKRELPYEVIIGGADLIVEGEIIDFNEDFYLFKITDFLKNSSEKIIAIRRFKDWTCESRLIPVEKGQRLLLFLSKSIDQKFYTLVNGTSGELFLNNKGVESVFAGEYFEFKDYQDIKLGIKLFTRAYKFLGELYPKNLGKKQKFRQIALKNELDKMIIKSKFFKSINKKTIQSYIVN